MSTAMEDLEKQRDADIAAIEKVRSEQAAKDARTVAIIESTQPLFNRVLVKMRRQDVTGGGIVVSDSGRVSATLAYVIRKGPHCSCAEIAVGGLVVLMKHVGIDVDLPLLHTEERYKVVREDEIAASLNGEVVEAWLRGEKKEIA